MNTSSSQHKKIRFLLWNLVFSFLLLACKENKKENNEIIIQWKTDKAEAIRIPLSFFPTTNQDSITGNLQVRLINNPVPVIHDEIEINNESVFFKPLITFTHGLKYEVLYSNHRIGHFEIPALSTEDLTEVVAIYPTADTLPENALKLYLVFSKPMQEGQALHNIHFIKNDKDTVPVFLDLAQELWDKERATLTLWFDPGRIKRDLQPNKNLGTPLQENTRYKMIIDKNWRDERGLAIRANYEKSFIVGKRDSDFPDPANWNVNSPKAATKNVLTIHLHESLDYLLLKNAISITDDHGKIINGSFEPASKETILSFTPGQVWKAGEYIINIEARLEDLAGNNLNRLFDKDLTQPNKNDQQKIFVKKFRVE